MDRTVYDSHYRICQSCKRYVPVDAGTHRVFQSHPDLVAQVDRTALIAVSADPLFLVEPGLPQKDLGSCCHPETP